MEGENFTMGDGIPSSMLLLCCVAGAGCIWIFGTLYPNLGVGN